jgi:hypothetical protein
MENGIKKSGEKMSLKVNAGFRNYFAEINPALLI